MTELKLKNQIKKALLDKVDIDLAVDSVFLVVKKHFERSNTFQEIENKIDSFYGDESETDLCDIGEYIATKLGYL